MAKAIILWVIVALLECVTVILFLPESVVITSASTESQLLEKTLGPSSAERLISSAKETYEEWCVETGVVKWTFDLFVPTETQRLDSKGAEDLGWSVFAFTRQRLKTFWNVVFIGLERFHGFGLWLAPLAPFLIASAFDGFTLRRVKLLTFGMSSAPLYGASLHLMILLVIFPILYFAWPFAVTPMVIPVWFLTLALALRTSLLHLQRM